MTEQQNEIKRVRGNIAPLIREFFAERLSSGKLQFKNIDLLRWVLKYVPDVAPDSPARIMRLLSEEGELSYKVVSRSGSEYRIQAQQGHQGRLF